MNDNPLRLDADPSTFQQWNNPREEPKPEPFPAQTFIETRADADPILEVAFVLLRQFVAASKNGDVLQQKRLRRETNRFLKEWSR